MEFEKGLKNFAPKSRRFSDPFYTSPLLEGRVFAGRGFEGCLVSLSVDEFLRRCGDNNLLKFRGTTKIPRGDTINRMPRQAVDQAGLAAAAQRDFAY